MPRPVIAWIGLDAPVEILSAVGAPVRLDADASAPAGEAGTYGEGGGHPWMRAVTGRLLAEAGSFDRVVIGSTPVTGVWLYNFLLTLEHDKGAPALPPLELINIAHGERPSAAALSRASVAGLAERLGAGEQALRAAIAERNAVRALQRRVDGLRHGPSRLKGSEARRLLDAADQMDATDYAIMAEQALAAVGSANDMTPVILSGPGSPVLDLYGALEARGLNVVGDDADYGTRAIGPDVAEGGDPIEALARRYAARSPAPAGWTTQARVEWLVGLATARATRAVVFDMPPWAHPPAWDFPAERQALEAAGIACIVLPDAPPAEQAKAAAAFRSEAAHA